MVGGLLKLKVKPKSKSLTKSTPKSIFYISAHSQNSSVGDLDTSSKSIGSENDFDIMADSFTEDTEVVVLRSLPDKLINCVR